MAATYDVTAIGPTIVETPDGRPVRGQVVSFVTKPSAIPGEVRVVDADATPDALAPVIEAAARNLEQIKAL